MTGAELDPAAIVAAFVDAHDEQHTVRHYEHGVLVGQTPLINIVEFIGRDGLRKTLTTEHLRAVLQQLADTQAREVAVRASRDRAARIAGRLEYQRDEQSTRRVAADAERNQAREVVAMLLLGIELHVGFDAIRTLDVTTLPSWATPWLTPAAPQCADGPEPGEPDLSNEPLGEIDV